MDIYRYLERINFDREIRSDVETLRTLAVAHLRSVPYENLDNHLGIPTVLDVDAFFRKIVHRRRGGGCYELNTLFGTLLRRLGFRVDFLAGQVFSLGKFGPPFEHLTLRVLAGGVSYLVDVGFGDGFHEPMRLISGQAAEYCQRQFRIKECNGKFRLESYRDTGLDKGLAFSLKPRRLEDFSKMNRFHSVDPQSWRSRRLVASRVTEQGRVSLVGNRRTLRTSSGSEKSEISDADYLMTLRQDFGIEIPYLPRPKSTRPSMRIRRYSQITAHRINKIFMILRGQESDGRRNSPNNLRE